MRKSVAREIHRPSNFRLHHIWPKYLGGPSNGPLVHIPAAYHAAITAAFLKQWGYGQVRVANPSAAQSIMQRVYSSCPIRGFQVRNMGP